MLAHEGIERGVLVFPTSFSQQRLWFLDQLAPGNPFYNIATAIPLRFAVNVTALERSLQEIVRRHEALRTTFAQSDGVPMQVVRDAPERQLSIVDLTDLPEGERAARALALATEDAQRPFDLVRGPLIRTSLVRLDEFDHVFLLSLHHIVADGWSMGVFFKELSALYGAYSTGCPSPLDELPLQYADYAVWQRDTLQGEALDERLAYWKQQLRDLPMLRLPTDRPRPPVQTFRGARLAHVLPASLSSRLNALGLQEGATPFMGLLAGFKALLYRYTGQDDIVVGCPIAGRTSAELEALIGFFVNTLVMRTSLSGDPTFRELLRRVRETALGAYAHQDLPFNVLVDRLHPDRDLARNPLFQVGFVLQNAWSAPGVDDAGGAPLDIERGTSIFDIALHCAEGPRGIAMQVEYSTDLFDAETIARFVTHLERLLTDAVARPDAPVSTLDIVPEEERTRLIHGFNQTARDFDRTRCFHEHFESHVAARPSAVALVTHEETLTYAELNRRANQLAWRLRAMGVKPDTLVGLCVERSAAMMVGLLGIMKAGGAYVALDPTNPPKHLRFMVEDAALHFVVTQSHVLPSLGQVAHACCLDLEDLSAEPAGNPPLLTTSSNLAYVIYTSGSTGRPKGVLIEHRGLINVMAEQVRLFGVHERSQVLQFASISFDASIFEIAMAFAAGSTLHVAPREALLPGPALTALMRDRRISVTTMPPSVVAALDPADLPALTTVTVAGEACPADLVSRWAADRAFFNLYGPTETTILASVARCVPAHRDPPIGFAIGNTRLYVLDARLEPVPIGVAGELHIAGTGVGRGYLNRADLTRERFLPDPFSTEAGARMYKTGDLARYLPDGQLEFLGRIDHQVKLRGYRIELGEIESVLRQHPGVAEAAVTVQDDAATGRRLVGYVTQTPAYAAAEGSSRAWSADHVEHWRTIYDEAYRHAGAHQDPRFSISGWNSSYTGLPIPDAEMREWRDHTVASIAALTPRRVLEIGCGTGLVLFALADRCEEYWATDFSRAALAHVAEHSSPSELAKVRLLHRTAEDFSGLPAGTFDVIVLNSVVQYFPNIDYLLRVLEGAVPLLAPGGSIFLGDVRSLPLLEAFHVSVEAQRAAPSIPIDRLRQRVRRRMLQEQELVIDPALFGAIAARIPGLMAEVRPKRGRSDNELTRFRYDVLLRTGVPGEPIPRRWMDWTPGRSLLASDRSLPGTKAALGIRGVPDSRLRVPVRMRTLLNGDDPPATTGELREGAAALECREPVLEDLLEEAEREGMEVRLAYAHPPSSGCVDVLLTPADRADARALYQPAPRHPLRPWDAYANNPLHGIAAQRLVPALREFLKLHLPDYMVPAAFLLLEAFPLTQSGKVDRRALPPPDTARPDLDEAFVAPRTPVEDALCEIWRQVLGIEQVGVRDNFFDVGGDSILSIQVVSRASQAGLQISPQDVFRYQTIAALAQAAAPSAPAAAAEQGRVTGPVPLTPIQYWFFDANPAEPHHFNQAVLLRIDPGASVALLSRALSAVVAHHDALRLRFARAGDCWTAEHAGDDQAPPMERVDIGGLPPDAVRAVIARTGARLHAGFDLSAGPLIRAIFYDGGPAAPGHLLIAAHHLVVDGVSWRILLEDLERAGGRMARGERAELPPKTVSFKQWAERLAAHASSAALRDELPYWLDVVRGPAARLPRDGAADGFGAEVSARTVVVALEREETRALLRDVPAAYHTQVNDVLLTAFAWALGRWIGDARDPFLTLEGHGREPLFDGVDTSRTVGWFTSQFPVRLPSGLDAADPGAHLVAVKEYLRAIPAHGIGFGLLRYLEPEGRAVLAECAEPEVMFNYLGQFSREDGASSSADDADPPGPLRSPHAARRYLLEVNAMVSGGRLTARWTYSEDAHRQDTIRQVADDFIGRLESLIGHCTAPGAGRYTPSDFSKARVTQKDLDRLLDRIHRS